jgi:hypothetical protein
VGKTRGKNAENSNFVAIFRVFPCFHNTITIFPEILFSSPIWKYKTFWTSSFSFSFYSKSKFMSCANPEWKKNGLKSGSPGFGGC